MRILIVLFTLLVMFGYGYAEDENHGFLLDEMAPFLVEKSEPEQEQEESEEGKNRENEEQSKVEVEQKKDEQEQNEAEEHVQEEQEGEQVTEEKNIDEQKEVAEPDVLQTQEEKSPAEVESPLVPATPEEEEQPEPATDSNKLEDIVDIQLAIALQAKKNELAELEQKLLKIECEKTKLLNEIKELREPPKKSKTNKPVYVSGSTQMPPGQSMFATLMVSSVDGMRAYVRDGGTAYYVRKGNRVAKGIIKDITSQGVFVQEETGVILYPVTH